MTDSFFDGFTASEAARITAAGTELTLPAGWSPIWEGTGADKAYVILDGEVSIRRHGEEVARLGAGHLVGETSIVNRALRNATVVTLTDVKLLHLTREAVTELAAEIPTFSDRLEQAVAQHSGE